MLLSPEAWVHWQVLCHAGSTEVAAFGVTSEHDPLYVERLWVPKQECTAAFCETEEGQFNDLLDWALDNQIAPSRVGRVWLHTHPGDSPGPSGTDEKTFETDFGGPDVAFMLILARGGQTSCRARFKSLKGATVEVPLAIRWSEVHKQFGLPSDAQKAAWLEEYAQKVTATRVTYYFGSAGSGPGPSFGHSTVYQGRGSAWGEWDDYQYPYNGAARTDDDDERPSRGGIVHPDTKEDAKAEFAEWLDDHYDMTIGQLDPDSLAQALKEYQEDGGVAPDDVEELEEAQEVEDVRDVTPSDDATDTRWVITDDDGNYMT